MFSKIDFKTRRKGKKEWRSKLGEGRGAKYFIVHGIFYEILTFEVLTLCPLRVYEFRLLYRKYYIDFTYLLNKYNYSYKYKYNLIVRVGGS